MGLIYTCFNATYILAFEGTDIYGNPYIYSFLNWKKDPLKSAMISLGNILVLFVLFLAYYFQTHNITFLNANMSREQEYFERIKSSVGVYVKLWKLARSLGRTKSVLQQEYEANKDK